MTNLNKITLKQLSEKLNGKLWEKGDKKRIYLDRGHNTKKMKTNTYIFQLDNGSFKVCCYIDCQSQGWNWIKSQQQEIIDSVQETIDFLIAENIFVLFNEKEQKYADYLGNLDIIEEAEKFLTKDGAKHFMEIENLSGYVIKSIIND